MTKEGWRIGKINCRKAILLSCIAFMATALSGYAAERAKLVAGPKIFLAERGTGLWDYTAYVNPEGEGYGPGPMVVDNNGYIYLPDTFGGAILVFTHTGERYDVITYEGLRHPVCRGFDDNNILHVECVTKGTAELVQYTIAKDGKGWEIREKPKVEPVPGSSYSEAAVGMTSPFGRDGLRYLRASDGYRLQLFDEDGNFVKFVPSLYYDQKGRYYKKGYSSQIDKFFVIVLNESGEVLGEFTMDKLGSPVRYRGWVYFYVKHDGNDHYFLTRYAPDGSVEEEIETEFRKVSTLYMSPNSEYCFTQVQSPEDGRQGIWVQSLTYREQE